MGFRRSKGKPSNKKGKKMRELASKSAEKSPDGSEAQVEPAPSSSASSSATSSGPAPAQAPAPAPASAPATAAVSPAPVASPAASAQATSAATSSPAVPVTEAPKEASASPALGGTVPSSAPAAPTPAAAAIAPTGTTTKAPAPETAATAPPEAAQARPNAPKNSYSAAANPFLAPPFASGPPEQAVVPSFRDNDKEDKFVAARNEENSKVSASMKNDMVDTIPVKSATPVPKLSYTEDQWSPFNPTGKKKYGRDLLMQIRLDPKSQKKPENLPEIDVLRKEDKSKGSLSRSMAQFGDFSSGLLRSNNPRGVPLQRKSTQGNKPGKPGKSSIIHMSLSLREDVKLHETENAWKPQMMKNEPVLSEEEAKTQEIYKTVRGVLNKLTPEKFNRLMAIVEELPIDNKQRMEGVIDLVFNKAVDEPNFSVAYAQMCNLLQRKEVPVEKNDGGEKVQFRKILISRCQKEFENSKAAELNKDEKQKEIENETDPEKKKELMFNFEEEERKIRRKSVGLVRFIGELFKKQMLTHQIMMRCVKDLLSKKDEESYECMCKLLTTIGDILESKGHTNELDQVFAEMRSLADKEKGGKNISSRVRFMLQDVIDLRDNKWVSRHGDTAPKTMEQIQRDAERENLESTIALSSQPNTPRKDERGAGRNMGSMDRRGNRGNQGSYGGKDDGWTNVLSNHRPRNVDFQKLRQNDSSQESLGSQVFFKSWSSGSQVQKETKKFTTPNKFDILPPDNSLSRPERNNPVVSRGSNSFKRTDSNLSSRSNSQQRLNSQPPSRESSVVRGESQKEKEDTKKRSAVSPPAPNKPVDLPAPDLVDEEEIKAACIKIIPETLGNISDVEEAYVCVEAAVGKSNYHHFVREIALLSLQNKSQGHDDIGKLIVSFMDKDVLDSSHLVSELAVIIETGPDIIFDAPMVWKYLADLLVPVIEAGKLSFKDVAQAATFLKENVPNHAVKFLQSLIQPFVLNKGPNWLRTHWEKHSVNWGDFLAEKDIEAFLADNNVSFMKGNVNPSEKGGSGSGLNQKEICDKLTELLRDSDAKDSFDAIREWITVNVGSGVKNKDFIYSLVTAICKSSLSESGGTWKLNNSLSQHDKLLAAYLDNVPEYEEQCLLAVEALVHSLEHPKGVIHTVFEFLWTNALVSVEAFQNWQKSGGPDGHGVAVSSLTSFFTMLSEADITDDEEA